MSSVAEYALCPVNSVMATAMAPFCLLLLLSVLLDYILDHLVGGLKTMPRLPPLQGKNKDREQI